MRRLCLFLGCFLLCFNWAFTQCLTDFSKLTPESTTDYTVDFGRALSMNNEFLAVGVPNSDSAGRVTGLVYIYKKIGTTWIKNSTIVPSIPLDGLQFGWSVKISEDYLFVGTYAQGGSVYVFRKQGTDWSSFSELAIWKVPGGQRFGGWVNYPISISADQNTIAITDIWHQDNSFPHESTGAIYLYHKGTSEEWSNTITPQLIPPPEVDVDDFGGGGVLFQGNRMATFTRFAPTANGRIYVYQDDNGAFDNPQLEAKLSVGDLTYSYGFGANNFAFTEDGIFLMGSVDVSTDKPKWEVVYFEQPIIGAWSDGYVTCHFDPDLNTDTTNWEPTLFTSSGNNLIISSRDYNNKGTLTYLKKGESGWCDPIRETIEENLPDLSTIQRYGLVVTTNQSLDIALGYVSHPATGVTEVALKTFARTGSGWEPNYLFSQKKSTAGHSYGRKILGRGDNMFVSAPYDGTVKASAGAVYIYTKTGSGWAKTSKILPPAGGQYDDVFASNMATSGDYLTVAAVGHSPSGKFFVYKKGTDWNNPQFVQEIDLRTAGLTVYISGDNVAMNEEWLVMPYMDSGSSGSISECHIFLALYKFNGSIFQYHQSLCIQGSNFFARSSTIPVSIEGNLIVAGSKIVELNEHGFWEIKHQLYPSDPEPIQFNSNFTIRTNGDRFGYSNYISNGTIFISAPTKDYNGIWDVGAVYVYTKLPYEEWSSRTESAKLVPHIKEPSGLFGYSLAALYNTLIVGSPLNDFDKNGLAINKRGLASIFQAQDYHWRNTNWIADFTGDSFVKDYFGLAVHLDETDFFMGAPIEDLETGKLSGSVYITPTPPLVKLVPPVCLSETSFELFGYPFEGVWTGLGITDPEKGTFNPSLAGPGTHTLTYQTPNCANLGILQIEVVANPLATVVNSEANWVCPGANSISINIGVEPQNNVTYLWYYRANASNLFTSQGVTTANMNATKRGEYQVKVSNSICAVFSPIITVQNETVEVTVVPPPTGCSSSTNPIPLSATPAGGVWQGSGVATNQFNPQNKAAGIYPLNYTYTSSRGCSYTKSTVVSVVTPYKPALTKSGDLCLNGQATLNLTTSVPLTTSVQWSFKQTDDSDFTVFQDGGNNSLIQKNGWYKVIAQTTFCGPEQAILEVNDSFTNEISPPDPSLQFCPDDDESVLSIQPINGMRFEWNYYDQSLADASVVNNSDLILRPGKSGYYFVSMSLGSCTLELPSKQVEILPADSVFIPNVFTPNGDTQNDLFKIITNDPSPAFEVFNRYGAQVYYDKDNSGWNGGNSPPGVYFWFASIANCKGERNTYKGTIQLVR